MHAVCGGGAGWVPHAPGPAFLAPPASCCWAGPLAHRPVITSAHSIASGWSTIQHPSVLRQQQLRPSIAGLRATRGGEGEESSSSKGDGAEGQQEVPPSAAEVELWEARRSIARALFTPVLQARQAKVRKLADKIKKKREAAAAGREEEEDASDDPVQNPVKTAVLSTAFVVAIFAAIARFGGRAAFLQLVGLDVLQDASVMGQVESFMSEARSMGPALKLGYFFVAWCVAKNLCLDPLAMVLALSSGILFNGVLEGTVASCLCATMASLVGFGLARTVLRDRISSQIAKRPLLRAVERSVARDGLKTVFTLRLSPLLPGLPVGGYSYLYGGATSVSYADFTLGILAGSIKPYFLDAYLGCVGESVLSSQQAQGGGDGMQHAGLAANDALLAATFFVLVLVGTLASQVAGKAWDEAKAEAKAAEGGGGAEGSWDWLTMLGVEPAKEGWRAVLEGEWARLEVAMDEEWQAMARAISQQQDPTKASAVEAAKRAAQEVEGGERRLVPAERTVAVAAEGQGGMGGGKAAETVLGLLLFPFVLMGQVGGKAGLQVQEHEAEAQLRAVEEAASGAAGSSSS